MCFRQTLLTSVRWYHLKLITFLGFLMLGLLVIGSRAALANVDLLYFRAESSSNTITLVWETETELDNLGFHLWRSQTGNQADATRINPTLIPSQVGGQPIGALYEYPDNNVQEQISYSYWLESVDVNNSSQFHGPVQASLGGGNTINTPAPGGSNPPEPTRTPAPPTATAAASNSSTPPGGQPTTGPNSTATIASLSASATAATPPPTAGGSTTNNPLPTSTQPAGTAQSTDSLDPANDGQPESDGSLPDPAAVTPIGAADPSAIAGNDAASAKPTATFIAGQNLAAVGEQGTANPNGDDTTTIGGPQSASNWRKTVAISTLVIGILLTAGGGFALWYLGRRRTDSL